ncbi:hypothetical protein A1S_3789 [Acinetobacter baumannii ATCC 17978]|nr:hypothetical protein A1S_3789 [Acinetobacter baumannii ATCC 17978]
MTEPLFTCVVSAAQTADAAGPNRCSLPSLQQIEMLSMTYSQTRQPLHLK